MKKDFTRLIASILFYSFLGLGLFALVNCGGGGGGGGGSAPTTGSLTINNGSQAQVAGVYISPTSTSSWGPNQLSNPIASGGSATIGSLPPNRYDARAIHLGVYSFYYAYLMNFPISAGSTYTGTIIDSSFTGTIRIINNSSWATLIAIYISPASASSWGANQLSSSIAHGTYRDIVDIPAGSYSVKGVWQDGGTTISDGIVVASMTRKDLTGNY